MSRRLLLSSLVLLALAAAACGRYLTTGVAVVNGVSIGQAELDERLEGVLDSPQFQGQIRGAEARLQAQRRIIVQMIQTELVRQEAERLGIRLSQETLGERLQQVRGQFRTEAEFQQALAQEGLDAGTLRERIRERLVLEQIQERLNADVQVTEADVRRAYGNGSRFEEIRVRHILFAIQGTNEAAALKEARGALAQLRAGADFAVLAKRLSDDPGTKDKGGDLGYVTRGRFVPEFEQAAFRLGKGKLSEPVRTQFGFHVIRVDDRRTKTFEQARGELTRELTQQRREAAFRDYIQERVKAARIVVNPRYGDFNPETLQIEPREFFVPPSPEPETEAVSGAQ